MVFFLCFYDTVTEEDVLQVDLKHLASSSFSAGFYSCLDF
jgi:hypothetical protein